MSCRLSKLQHSCITNAPSCVPTKYVSSRSCGLANLRHDSSTLLIRSLHDVKPSTWAKALSLFIINFSISSRSLPSAAALDSPLSTVSRPLTQAGHSASSPAGPPSVLDGKATPPKGAHSAPNSVSDCGWGLVGYFVAIDISS